MQMKTTLGYYFSPGRSIRLRENRELIITSDIPMGEHLEVTF